MDKNHLLNLSDFYGLPGLEFAGNVQAGYLNHNYILTDGKKRYFCKNYRDDFEHIKDIHRVKQFFADGGIPVILPIRNPSGETIFVYGDKYFGLFPFAEGRFINQKDTSEKALVSMGALLAKMHLLSKNKLPDNFNYRFRGYNKEDFISKSEEVLNIINNRETKDEFDRYALEDLEYKRALVMANTKTLDEFHLASDHMLHGDFYSQNMFFDNDDNVRYIFDFEKVQLGPRAYELLRAVDVSCFEGEFEEINFLRGRIFMRAYNDIYPVALDDLRKALEIYYLRGAHATWIEREHYLKNNYRTDLFLEIEHRRNVYFHNNRELFLQKLTESV